MIEIKIKSEFRDLIPKLTDEEFAQLEANILEAGEVKEPIIVWNGYIVDGHHRWYIIEKHPEIPYRIEEMEFENEHAAMAWACRNQLGRRNLTEADEDYLTGKEYTEAKLAHGGDRGNQYTKKPKAQNELLADSNKTAAEIGRHHGKSRETVKRSENYAKGVDIADEIIPGMKDDILHGDIQVPKKVMRKIPKVNPDAQKEAVELISKGEMHKAEIVLDGDADIIEGLYDTGEEVAFTEDDLLQELSTNFYKYMSSLDTILESHSDLLADAGIKERTYKAYINLLKAKISDLEEDK